MSDHALSLSLRRWQTAALVVGGAALSDWWAGIRTTGTLMAAALGSSQGTTMVPGAGSTVT